MSENEALREQLYDQLKDFHLLRHRAFQLSEKLSDRKKIQQLIEDHEKKVKPVRGQRSWESAPLRAYTLVRKRTLRLLISHIFLYRADLTAYYSEQSIHSPPHTQTGARTKPDNCNMPSVELDVLRAEIDILDEQLVELLARRFRVTARVGAVKKQLALHPVDAKREARQLANYRALAVRHELDSELVVRLFRAIIDEVVINHRRV